MMNVQSLARYINKNAVPTDKPKQLRLDFKRFSEIGSLLRTWNDNRDQVFENVDNLFYNVRLERIKYLDKEKAVAFLNYEHFERFKFHKNLSYFYSVENHLDSPKPTLIKRPPRLRFGERLENLVGMVWFTSDLHFFHKQILRFGKGRKHWDNLDQMHEDLIDEWNLKVGINDTVFVLGDFTFKGANATKEIINQLKGNIVFIAGNHDRKTLNNLDVNVFDYLEVSYQDTKIVMSHYPMSCWNRQAQGSIMFHGHTHGEFVTEGKILDVGFDMHGKIMELNDLMEIVNNKPIYCPDGRNMRHGQKQKGKKNVV